MTATNRLVLLCQLFGLTLFSGLNQARCQTQPTEPHAIQPQASQPAGTIHGIVKSGNMPIPGAAVGISSASLSEKIATWTDVDGSYSTAVPSYGSYTVRVQMVAFANSTEQVVIDAAHQNVPADFELTLLSRTREATPQPRRAGRAGPSSARISEPFSAAEHGWSGCGR